MVPKIIAPFTEANKAYVSSLYRQALRTSLNWTIDRSLYRVEAVGIRRKFDVNKNVADPAILKSIFTVTEQMLYETTHPEPIIPPQRPGGTKFERNAPPVLDEPLPGHY
ncbi:hypothetical protein CANCADRAFT_140497 [Tortispora caseinolytica NRRL Y-17796]|uniref:NADH dehydrogenase [ubiquinone] 1 beta subcomplex subunit 9 n=1 Tax=Tortispora caseinolytica NRRL Y-17796 TaxID=767744 RepID=A0A1E4TCQ0_9ASCO|nr:hypothetical protein CANCADRAFT_140497 [Tortispora caseinolytica NRRL Y-17796]